MLMNSHVTKALDNVNPDFWNGITHCLVVAALGAQGVGKCKWSAPYRLVCRS
jgi:hypothetical protein